MERGFLWSIVVRIEERLERDCVKAKSRAGELECYHAGHGLVALHGVKSLGLWGNLKNSNRGLLRHVVW